MTKYLVMAHSTPGGGVTLRICRRKTEDPEADNAPLPLTYGTLDIPLTAHEMHDLGMALNAALWEKILK